MVFSQRVVVFWIDTVDSRAKKGLACFMSWEEVMRTEWN